MKPDHIIYERDGHHIVNMNPNGIPKFFIKGEDGIDTELTFHTITAGGLRGGQTND